MTISLRSRGESLTGLTMGLLVSRQEGKACLRKIDEALQKIAKLLSKEKKYPNTLHAITFLCHRVTTCYSQPICIETAIEIINLSQVIAAKFTKDDNAFPEQILCPNPSTRPYDPNAVFPIPAHFIYADKNNCHKLFMKALYNQNEDEIRRWLQTVQIERTINFDELQPEHMKLILEANPTSGAVLRKTTNKRFDNAFVLFLNGVRGEEWCLRRIFNVQFSIQEYHNLYYREVVQEFNEMVKKEIRSTHLIVPYADTIMEYYGNLEEIINQFNFQEDFTLIRYFQTELRNQVIEGMMRHDHVDLDPGIKKMDEFNQVLIKMKVLAKMNLSIIALITEYCFSEEEMLFEALKNRQLEICAEIEKEREAAPYAPVRYQDLNSLYRFP